MQSPSRFLFWWRWLVVVTLGVLLFGITLIVAPEFTRRFFGLLLFSAPETLATFGSPAVAYLTLLHGVLGAVMVGWAVALLFVLIGPFRQRSKQGWLALVVPLLAWFVPYTALSLWSGFWPNAALNLVFAVLFAVPLAATSGAFNEKLA
jgi:uncharacterized membrane protein YhaH (DUF805 family)